MFRSLDFSQIKKILVAIDGPTGSGKTVCGKLVAKKLNLNFLDTGVFYRLFALYWNKKKEKIINKKIINNFNVEFTGEWKLNKKIIPIKNLYTFEIEQTAKIIALNKQVRKKINELCWKIIKDKRYLIVGRDTTTVIAPNADVKIYLDTTFSEQVKRKKKIFSEIKSEKWSEIIKKTNIQEKSRSFGKLFRTSDSIYLKNENMTIEEAVNKLIKLILTNFNILPIISIIGPTNAGKSTLFNALVGTNAVITSKKEHTTRDLFNEKVKLGNSELILVDSGGLAREKKAIWQEQIDERVLLLIEKSFLIVFIVEITETINIFQNKLFKYLKKKKKEIILVINKSETRVKTEIREKWKAAPIETTIYISAKEKKGIDVLKKLICQKIPTIKNEIDKKKKETMDILIAGRPNAGKSTLFNEIVRMKKSIVSATPHTTTNLVKKEVFWGLKKIIFYDSAGLRKKRLRRDLIEKAAEKQIFQKLKSTDLLILVIDINEEMMVQDKKIMKISQNLNIQTIIVGNKIDLIKTDYRVIKKKFEFFWGHLKEKEIIFISALNGKGIRNLIKKIEKKYFFFQKK